MAFILIPIMTVVAYLLGSLSAAIIVSRYFGMEDPRTYGSGNPGASNMLRSGNKKAAALTLAGDALKGLLAVLLAKCLQGLFDLGDGIVAMAALAVVIGHMYPLFFHFKGGKGVATALGVILGMSFWTTFWVLGIWLVIAYKFKKSSLAALVAAACTPFVSFIVQGHHPKLSWALFFIAILVLYRHKDNIQRLKSGNELGIGEPAQPLYQSETKVETSETSANSVADDSEVLDKAIAEEIAHAEELVEEAEQKAKEAVEEVVEKTKEVVAETVEKAKETAEEVREKAKETTEKVSEKTKEALVEVTEKTKETVEKVSEKAKENAEQAAEKVKETTEKVKETAKEVAQEAVENVKTDIDAAVKKQDAENANTSTTKSTRGRKKKTNN